MPEKTTTAKDLLANLPEAAMEEYTLSNGAVLKVRGITSFQEAIEIGEAVDMRRALPDAPPDTVVKCVETFRRGVVDPPFSYSEALEFSRRSGVTFAAIVGRINELSIEGVTEAVQEARERIESDPTSAA